MSACIWRSSRRRAVRSASRAPGPPGAGAGLVARVLRALVGAGGGAVGLGWSRGFLPGSAAAAEAHDPIFVRPPRKLWALGALAFACLLIEGASADWSG